MLSTFRLADNLVPLFLGVLATILSIVASVPGRLEEHSQLPRPQRDKDVYFVTGSTSGWDDRFTYGFIYSASHLENIHEDLRSNFTHIHGEWYIFNNK